MNSTAVFERQKQSVQLVGSDPDARITNGNGRLFLGDSRTLGGALGMIAMLYGFIWEAKR